MVAPEVKTVDALHALDPMQLAAGAHDSCAYSHHLKNQFNMEILAPARPC
jgi:organic hydroperoxide reductase OsmC/OhrA